MFSSSNNNNNTFDARDATSSQPQKRQSIDFCDILNNDTKRSPNGVTSHIAPAQHQTSAPGSSNQFGSIQSILNNNEDTNIQMTHPTPNNQMSIQSMIHPPSIPQQQEQQQPQHQIALFDNTPGFGFPNAIQLQHIASLGMALLNSAPPDDIHVRAEHYAAWKESRGDTGAFPTPDDAPENSVPISRSNSSQNAVDNTMTLEGLSNKDAQYNNNTSITNNSNNSNHNHNLFVGNISVTALGPVVPLERLENHTLLNQHRKRDAPLAGLDDYTQETETPWDVISRAMKRRKLEETADENGQGGHDEDASSSCEPSCSCIPSLFSSSLNTPFSSDSSDDNKRRDDITTPLCQEEEEEEYCPLQRLFHEQKELGEAQEAREKRELMEAEIEKDIVDELDRLDAEFARLDAEEDAKKATQAELEPVDEGVRSVEYCEWVAESQEEFMTEFAQKLTRELEEVDDEGWYEDTEKRFLWLAERVGVSEW